LAKAALNAPHTQHAQYSVAVAVPEICRQSQNLKAGHVTSSRTGPLNNLLCVVWDRTVAVYIHAELQVTSFSRSGDTRGSQNLKVHVGPHPSVYWDQDPRVT